jgi:hypothetical protein
MKSAPAWWPGGRVAQNTACSPACSSRVALTAASAPAFAAAQVPAQRGDPLSIEYRPRRAVKFVGSTSLRKVRTGQTEGNGWRSALPGSSASQSAQAPSRNAR